MAKLGPWTLLRRKCPQLFSFRISFHLIAFDFCLDSVQSAGLGRFFISDQFGFVNWKENGRFSFVFCFVLFLNLVHGNETKKNTSAVLLFQGKQKTRNVWFSRRFFFYRVLPSFTLSGAEVLPSFFIFFPGLVHFDGETSLSIPKAMERIFPKKITVIFYDANEKSVFTEFYLVLLNLVVFFFWSRPL